MKKFLIQPQRNFDSTPKKFGPLYQLQQQTLEANSQCNSIKPVHDEQQGDNISASSTDSIPGATQINTTL